MLLRHCWASALGGGRLRVQHGVTQSGSVTDLKFSKRRALPPPPCCFRRYPFVQRAADATNPKGVVVMNEDGETVDAVMVNEDFRMAPPPEYRMLPAEWRPVRACFRELHTRFKANYSRPVAEGEILHCLYFTCVRPEVRGQGLMKALWDETQVVARDYGYKQLVAEAPTREVRSVLEESLGFKEVAAVEYADWRFEGTTPTEALALANPVEWSRLSISVRNVFSNMY